MSYSRDGNKANNFVTNLEWVTAKENFNHAVENNLRKRNYNLEGINQYSKK